MRDLEILYAGYAPVFGTTGSHPQFLHRSSPPKGYTFLDHDSVAGADSPKSRRLLVKAQRLAQIAPSALGWACKTALAGSSPSQIAQFAYSRNLRSQLQLPTNKDLVFL